MTRYLDGGAVSMMSLSPHGRGRDGDVGKVWTRNGNVEETGSQVFLYASGGLSNRVSNVYSICNLSVYS